MTKKKPDLTPQITMLTTSQVARMLNVGPETVRTWIREGQIPCAHLPGRGKGGIEKRIPLSYVENLVRIAYEEQGLEYTGTEVSVPPKKEVFREKKRPQRSMEEL